MRAAAPPPNLTVSEWADANRRLSPEASAEPGRWKTDRAPYQRGIMDAFSDPRVRRVVCKTSAQIGKTEVLLNVCGFHIHHDPCPMLVIQPTLELAESFSKDRLATMIRDTPALFGRVTEAKAKKGDNTLLKKGFRGGQMTLAGANSPSSLASRPVRMVLLDEVDRYPISAGTEGDPVNLAVARTKTFHNKKIGAWSTPLIKGTSRIDQMYEDSDMRRYHVPCPHCQAEIVLRFDRFHWEKDDPDSVHYLCNICDAIIEEHQKPAMLSAGRWIAEKPFLDVAGFHIWEAYSPWVRWPEIVKTFLDAKKNPEQLKTFINTSLGECWEQKGDAPDWKRLYDRRELYPMNTIPKGVHFLVCGVDVQADRLECEIVGYGKYLESWDIDFRVFRGSTATDVPWAELDKLLQETWPTEAGLQMPIRMMGVDSGYNTQTVYNWTRKYPVNRVIATKGRDGLQAMIGTPSKVDVNVRGRKIDRGALVWPIGVSIIKSEIFGFLKLEAPMSDQPFPPGWCHFPQYDEEFFKQLTAEQLVLKRKSNGFSRYEWEKTRERNEALDTRVICRALASVLGIDRYREEDWKRIEATEMPTVKPATSGIKNGADKPIAVKRRPSTFL